MPTFQLSPAALLDLETIFDYTAQNWGFEQAQRYLHAIEAVCHLLAQSPQLGTDCSHIRSGYRRCKAEQHVLYYRPTGDGVAVIRILHQRMDAPRHLSQ
jgi:toxin ParE1/3/4